MEFKEIIKDLRTSSNLSQKQVADVLGISDRAYQHYEYGTRYPDFHGLIKIADYFDVSLDYLTGRSKVKERQ